MITLEDQIARVVDEAESQLDTERAAVRSPDRRSWRPRLLVAATVALVVGAAIALPLVVRDDPEGTTTPLSDDVGPGPRPLVPNVPTVVADPDERWIVPAELPDGLEFESAVDYGIAITGSLAPSRSLRFADSMSDASVTVYTNLWPIGDPGDDAESSSVEVDGERWMLVTSPVDDRPPVVTLGLEDASATFGDEFESVVVTVTELDQGTVVDVASSLTVRSAADLPLPPLELAGADDGAEVVAEATQNGVPKRLVARTDGINFAMSVDGAGGSPVRLGDRYVAVDGASGPNPNLVLDGRTAESLIWGLVHPDVATVAVELTDGTLVESEPQDLRGFNEDFFLIAFPTSTEGGLERLSAAVALDATGGELGRDDSLGR